MSLDVDSAFELMERAVKRLSITIVDDFEEIKRGTPRPIVALLRKLLFYTSTLIMKQMLLRGCPSHVSDKKVVIATFDLLREQMKFSPVITIDQFLSQTYVAHKLQVIMKLAEYITATDRSVTKTPSKVNFVVPPVDYNHSPHNQNTNTFEPNMYDEAPESPQSLLNPMFCSSGSRSPTPTHGLSKSFSKDVADDAIINQEVLSKSAWPMTDFIKLHLAEKLHAKGISAQGITPRKAATPKAPTPKSRSGSPNTFRSTASTANTSSTPSRAGSAPRLSVTSQAKSTSPKVSSASPQQSSSSRLTPRTKRLDLSDIQLSELDTSVNMAEQSPKIGNPSQEKPVATTVTLGTEEETVLQVTAAQLNQMVDARVEVIAQERVDAAMKAMLEKNDMIMSKIVSAVDAEFTLLRNRIRVLESALESNNNVPPPPTVEF